MAIERRDYDLESLEVRQGEGGETIRGLALPFNRNSADLGGFVERIAPSAVSGLEGSDVVMLWQHDSAEPITRQSTGLQLEVRKSGVYFEAAASDFTERQLDLLQRGVVKQMSFGFVTLEDSWEQERKPVRRTLMDIELREISPVTWPAYKQTSVAVRSALSAGIDLRVVPDNISTAIVEDRNEAWARPRLEDFTDEAWEDLDADYRDRVAGHFTWAPTMPPDTFSELSLPHHRASDGKVVWRGLVAAAARLNQTRLPESAMNAVRAHLAEHYRAFGEEAPWERSDGVDAADQLRRERLRLLSVDL
jgi:HK97 family phage prohead protease